MHVALWSGQDSLNQSHMHNINLPEIQGLAPFTITTKILQYEMGSKRVH
jgi:hypothetical protein